MLHVCVFEHHYTGFSTSHQPLYFDISSNHNEKCDRAHFRKASLI